MVTNWNFVEVKLPNEGDEVIAQLIWNTGKITHAVLVYVNKERHTWESEGCELSYAIRVVKWSKI